MGRMLTITNSKESNLGIKKRSMKREVAVGNNAIKFIAVAVFATLALIYLTQATEGANRSLRVRDITDKKAELELKKERLEVEKVRLQSLQQIDQNIEKPTMEPVSKVDHLNSESADLAAR